METVIKITLDQFEEKYKPIVNPQEAGNGTPAEWYFETYDTDSEIVQAILKEQSTKDNGRHVWTVTESDGVIFIQSGKHLVNRLNYILTEVAFEEGESIEVTFDEEKPNTIDLTPTWESLVPGIIAVLQDGTAEGQKKMQIELRRMAQAADKWNEYCDENPDQQFSHLNLQDDVKDGFFDKEANLSYTIEHMRDDGRRGECFKLIITAADIDEVVKEYEYDRKEDAQSDAERLESLYENITEEE